MACPEPSLLSAFCDAAASATDEREIAAHLERCPRCRSTVAEERRLAQALATLACPEPETLARFVDEVLPAGRLEQVAAHVLRCEPCREVVAWTREAEAAGVATKHERRSSGRRRRRALAPRRTSPWTVWAGAGVAAAAAVLLVVALRGERAGTGQVATQPERPHEQPNGVPAPQAPTSPPRPTPAPTPAPEPDPSPTPVEPGPGPEAPPVPEPSPQGPPGPADPALPGPPEPTGTRPPEPAPPPTPPAPPTSEGVLIAALDEGLTLRRPDGSSAPLLGGARVPAGSALVSAREGAAIQVGRATCLLPGAGELACSPGPQRVELTLAAGEVAIDDPDGGLVLRAGQAEVRPITGGLRYVLSREANDGALLCLVAGKARFGQGDAALTLEAGGAARLERGAVRLEKRPEPALGRARELLSRAELVASVDVPRGLVALRALKAAEPALAGDAIASARAAQAVFALRAAEPRLAKLAARLAPAAGAALDALLARDPSSLDPAAQAPTLLAALARARALHPGKTTLAEPERTRLTALAEAIASRPAGELAGDPEALLSLRAAERVARFRPARAAFEGPAPSDPVAALLQALLARKKDPALAQRVREQLAATLGASPWQAPLPPADLLRAARALALLGDDALAGRLVAHAWATRNAEPALALIVAQETRALLGTAAPDPGPSSVLVAPAAEGWRVTFVHRPGKRPKSLHLVASWDGWKPDSLAMEARPDGSWVITATLPAGRHEYKLIVDRDAWITDPLNPLTAPSNVNETENSVLLLE